MDATLCGVRRRRRRFTDGLTQRQNVRHDRRQTEATNASSQPHTPRRLVPPGESGTQGRRTPKSSASVKCQRLTGRWRSLECGDFRRRFRAPLDAARRRRWLARGGARACRNHTVPGNCSLLSGRPFLLVARIFGGSAIRAWHRLSRRRLTGRQEFAPRKQFRSAAEPARSSSGAA